MAGLLDPLVHTVCRQPRSAPYVSDLVMLRLRCSLTGTHLQCGESLACFSLATFCNSSCRHLIDLLLTQRTPSVGVTMLHPLSSTLFAPVLLQLCWTSNSSDGYLFSSTWRAPPYLSVCCRPTGLMCPCLAPTLMQVHFTTCALSCSHSAAGSFMCLMI